MPEIYHKNTNRKKNSSTLRSNINWMQYSISDVHHLLDIMHWGNMQICIHQQDMAVWLASNRGNIQISN